MYNFGWNKLVEDGPYKVILADPPWSYKTWSKKGEGRSASQHYNTMSLEDIKTLPVNELADKDCVLFLWATDPLLPKALEVMDSWGFTYKSVGFYWVKLNKSGKGFFTGLGHWTRANPEMCLLGTKGKPHRLDKGVKRLLVDAWGGHSSKPEEAQNRIERLVPGPYCELFARRVRPNWHCWGAECEYGCRPPQASPIEKEYYNII